MRDPVERWTDRRPLPVLAITLWTGFSGVCFVLFSLSSLHVLPFFGSILHGAPAMIGSIAVGCLWLFAARALYRIEKIGWWLAVVLVVLFALSSTLTYLRHDQADLYRAMNYSPEEIARISQTGLLSQRGLIWTPWGFALPMLGYLIYLRKFFRREG